jgi:hypothetical protein
MTDYTKRQGYHEDISLRQYAEVKEKIEEMLEAHENGDIELNEGQRTGYKTYASIVENLQSGNRTVQWRRCNEISISKDSQGRAVSEDSNHLKTTIRVTKRKKKILAPLLTRKTMADIILADGYHRLTAVKKLVKASKLDHDFIIPTVEITIDEGKLIQNVLASIQGNMNEPPIEHLQKGNTPNDLRNIIKNDVELNDVDLSDEDQFNNMVNRYVLEYPNHEDQISRAMNRQKNINARNQVGVITDTASNFEEEFWSAFHCKKKSKAKCAVGDASKPTRTFRLKDKVYTNTYIHRIATKGSELNSSKMLLAQVKYDDPKQNIIELHCDLASSGDKQTTIRLRARYFMHEYKCYKIFGERVVSSDAVVFVPQLDGETHAELTNGDMIRVKTEDDMSLQSNWGSVTREERLEHYRSNPAVGYRPEWLSPHTIELKEEEKQCQ